MKKVLYIVGAGLAIGAVVAGFYWMNSKKDKTSEGVHKNKTPYDKFEGKNSEPSKEVIVPQDDIAYEDVKNSSIGNMYSRHEGAATVMRESVDAIRKNIHVSDGTNDEIDDISAELDKMISED